MEFAFLYILLAILGFNFINIFIVVSISNYLEDSNATSPANAVSVDHNPFYKLYLIGPILPWANLHRTKDGKYWYNDENWSAIKISVYFGFGTILFFNILLLLYFLAAY